MFLKQVPQKNGRINISIVHGFRDPVTKQTKHQMVKRLGYVDEYEHLYEDPIAHFKAVARQMTLEMRGTHPLSVCSITPHQFRIIAVTDNRLGSR